jgi:signal transduction histidine kinase
MTDVRRFARAAQSFLVDRSGWQIVAVPVTVITLLLHRGPYRISGGYPATFVLAALIVAASGLLVLLPRPSARAWHVPLIVVIAICGGLLTVAIPQSWTIVLPYLVAVIAARRYRLRVALIVIATCSVTIVLNVLGHHGSGLGLVDSLAIMGAVTMGALARRSRGERLEQMELALAREQAAREEHARAAALAERARIAREVHDVLAHSLSALSLNLQGARLMLAREDASDETQEQIRRAQRLAVEGLAEARRAVAALRDDPVTAARAIADLVTSARLDGGTAADLTVEGIPRDLPGPAEDTLFRTAQEALSNARKHAAGAPVRVVLAYRDGTTELTVTDCPGHRPTTPAAGGYGLTGMRERAELIGGELWTGPTDDGWQVRLVVPA